MSMFGSKADLPELKKEFYIVYVCERHSKDKSRCRIPKNKNICYCAVLNCFNIARYGIIIKGEN